MKKTNHEMHHRVNDQSSQPGFKRTVMRFSAETRIRAQGSRLGFRAAAAAVAAAFLMTGCGTTPPPEPQGERIWVNFPAFETKQKDVAAPLTDRNAVGSRVVVRKVEREVLVPRELEALRAGERSETNGTEPDLRMRPDQPVPTPPVAAASKAGEANAATETKPLADAPHAAVPAGKENERHEANAANEAMPAPTLKAVLKPALTSVMSMGAESAGAAVSDESSSLSSSSASSALRPAKTVPFETDSGVRGGQAAAAASATTSTSTSISISISAGSAAAEKEAADSRALSSPSSPASLTASDAAVRAESVDPGATPTSTPDTKPVKEEKTHEENEENEEKASEKDVVKKDDLKERASEEKIGGGDAILGGTALPSREDERTAEDISTGPSGVSVPLGRHDLQEESAPSVQVDSVRQPKEDSEPEKPIAEGTN